MGILLYSLLGLLVGILVNSLADDLPERRRPTLPHCIQCGQSYRPRGWSGLVRKLSGRCPACGAPERWRPLLVEVGMVLVFAFLWVWYGGFSPKLLVSSTYMAIFALILVTDMEHRLILHVVTFPAIAFALLASFVTVTPGSALLGAAVGFGLFFAIYLVGGVVYGAGAMGFGDVTLSTFIGAAVGFPIVMIALLGGILAGGIITLALLLTRIRRMSSKIPYGPFLLIGATISLLWGEKILAWYLR